MSERFRYAQSDYFTFKTKNLFMSSNKLIAMISYAYYLLVKVKVCATLPSAKRALLAAYNKNCNSLIIFDGRSKFKHRKRGSNCRSRMA